MHTVAILASRLERTQQNPHPPTYLLSAMVVSLPSSSYYLVRYYFAVLCTRSRTYPSIRLGSKHRQQHRQRWQWAPMGTMTAATCLKHAAVPALCNQFSTYPLSRGCSCDLLYRLLAHRFQFAWILSICLLRKLTSIQIDFENFAVLVYSLTVRIVTLGLRVLLTHGVRPSCKIADGKTMKSTCVTPSAIKCSSSVLAPFTGSTGTA